MGCARRWVLLTGNLLSHLSPHDTVSGQAVADTLVCRSNDGRRRRYRRPRLGSFAPRRQSDRKNEKKRDFAELHRAAHRARSPRLQPACSYLEAKRLGTPFSSLGGLRSELCRQKRRPTLTAAQRLHGRTDDGRRTCSRAALERAHVLVGSLEGVEAEKSG